MALTSIVMLTRNGLDLTRLCVNSIVRHTDESYEFIFVDNGSTDETIAFLETVPNATIIRNSENRGFAAGNNQGMIAAKGEYILLLNNDTVVTPEWLKGLHIWLQRDSSIGIVGPVSNNVAPIQQVYLNHDVHSLDASATLWREQHLNTGFYSHRLIGFCMLFHRSLLDTIGGLDERFYPGNYEDDDFCLRARISGQNLWVAKDVFIHHEGQGTFKGNRINYQLSSLSNAERFTEKWSVGLSPFEIDQLGYNPSSIVSRENFFIPERHFITIPKTNSNEWIIK